MRQWPLALALVGLGLLVRPAPGQDTIRYFNRKAGKDDTVRATVLDEGPGKVRFRVSGQKEEEIAAADVLEISYAAPRGVAGPDWRAPSNKEELAQKEKKPELYQEALAAYKALAPRVSDARMHRRHIEYRMALIQATLAEFDPKQLDTAIEALKKFTTDYGDGWQLVPAVKVLVRLYDQKGDAASAQAAYESLADNSAVPREVRREASLLVVRHLLRKGKHTEAAAKAKAVQTGLTADDPLGPRIQVYLAACDLAAGRTADIEKRLKALAGGTGDADAKALAHNTLGDYYRGAGRNEDAFWEYLWVDVHYNQDREELARAVYQLSRLFAEVRKDTLRAREYLDRLCDEREFGGLDLHKKALAERAAAGG